MSRMGNLSRTSWVVIGVVGALILVPSAAVATAAGVTELVGTGGQRAAVSDAGQLSTAEAAPSSFDIEFNATTAKDACVSLPVISKTEGFIVTEIAVDTYQLPSPGEDSAIAAYRGTGCVGTSGFIQVNPPSLGLTTIPMDPGYAIPKGGSISFEGTNNTEANIDVFGYKVPAKDAPGYTTVQRP
jgi:hypothetical protein